jgi:hypothetical protein
MKKLKLFSMLFICALGLNLSYAQATKVDKKAAKAAEIKRIISSGSYVFKATYVIPMSMAPRNLNSDYDVTVTKDKLDIYLPYFGRAYAAPRDLYDGGLKLTTSSFKNVTLNKKGGWDITIKPTDSNPPGVKDIQVLYLTVNPDGYASLRVTSLNKQPISFNGYIDEIKKK